MKHRILPCLILWLALGVIPMHAAFINGHSYVPMADWAEANGLKTTVDRHGTQFSVSNRATNLKFEANSAQVLINGVAVRLCYPAASQKGVPLISQLDAGKTIRPFLYPPRSPADKKITTVCLDPGHGGKDTGNRVGSFNEKTYTLALAQELRGQLQQAGFNVILTRTQDTYVDLPARPALANRRGADLFVSLHFNATATGQNDVWGPETYCITPAGASSSNAEGEGSDCGPTTANHAEQKSLFLAYQTQKSLVRSLRVPDRSVRRARFAVLRDAIMPAILIEGGYMTNPLEGKRIFDSAYRHVMARAIVQGILAYQKIIQPQAATAPPHLGHPPMTRAGHAANF